METPSPETNRWQSRALDPYPRGSPAAHRAARNDRIAGVILDLHIFNARSSDVAVTHSTADRLAGHVTRSRAPVPSTFPTRDRSSVELHPARREPSDWKPMPAVGAGVMEIRVHASGEHRILVVTKLAPAVFVLHAFEKKSRKTSRRDIELARRRYRELIREREEP